MDDDATAVACEEGSLDVELAQALASIREQRLEADRCAAVDEPHQAVALYDDAGLKLFSLLDASSDTVLHAEHRMETLHARLGAARVLTYLQDWRAAEARATAAIEAGLVNEREWHNLAAVGLLPSEAPAMSSGRGRIAHRDCVDAFLYRARARLRLGEGRPARDDAATAQEMARHLGEAGKAEVAEGLLAQAELMQLAGTGAPSTVGLNELD
mmetsp:Transcript_92767/g.170440  ORF Transcript_92767/g.170440 Transcript_92767/m.170440 type:complete len:213 (-) Transcript_92767:32-670(-)